LRDGFVEELGIPSPVRSFLADFFQHGLLFLFFLTMHVACTPEQRNLVKLLLDACTLQNRSHAHFVKSGCFHRSVVTEESLQEIGQLSQGLVHASGVCNVKICFLSRFQQAGLENVLVEVYWNPTVLIGRQPGLSSASKLRRGSTS